MQDECVQVALRIRPLAPHESAKSNELCLKAESGSIQLSSKGANRQFKFTYNLGPEKSQQEQLIDASLNGFATTIFAYGQTGSGKTYTIVGKEKEKDQHEGIAPKAIHSIFRKTKQIKSGIQIKASFLQIYNEQIKDLLNPASGVLHCRYNQANGFYVEELIVVECTSEDDLMAVLKQGIKNRKISSHQLNKDSSRSHSILTVWLICQTVVAGQGIKKFGKISFVDLAGSERLKESGSKGEMVRQTGNINKSLFMLGKVIKILSEKKEKHVPYRDSKLTMLLMDSLGGSSKALMFACVTPSTLFLDETLSTLNYATRTMNIKNTPLLQIDQKQQSIINIRQQIEQLRQENAELREEVSKVGVKKVKGSPKKSSMSESLPPIVRAASQHQSASSSRKVLRKEIEKDGKQKSKGLQKKTRESGDKFITKDRGKGSEIEKEKQATRDKTWQRNNQSHSNAIMAQYRKELMALQKRIQTLRSKKLEEEEKHLNSMKQNNELQGKLNSLENIFVGKVQKPTGKALTNLLLSQNNDLKTRLTEVIKHEKHLKQQQEDKGEQQFQEGLMIVKQIHSLTDQNGGLDERIKRLNKRERELLDQIKGKRK